MADFIIKNKTPGTEADARLSAPVVKRNRDPILFALRDHMPRKKSLYQDGIKPVLLELGSGSGEHAAYIAPRLGGLVAQPDLIWQPSDPFDPHLNSVNAWRDIALAERKHYQPDLHTRYRPALQLNAQQSDWNIPLLHEGGTQLTTVFAANILHITHWDVSIGMITGAAKLLPQYGRLLIYGPFKINGQASPSNLAFDKSLQSQDPDWGVRDVIDLSKVAVDCGFVCLPPAEMPSNNLLLVFEKQ